MGWIRDDLQQLEEGDSILAAERQRLELLAAHNAEQRRMDAEANAVSAALFHRQQQPVGPQPPAPRGQPAPRTRAERLAYGLAVFVVAGCVMTGAFIGLLILVLVAAS